MCEIAMPHEVDNATEANTMSRAPLVFTNSLWKRSSAATFFRRRRKRESMRGDCPRMGEYISEEKLETLMVFFGVCTTTYR